MSMPGDTKRRLAGMEIGRKITDQHMDMYCNHNVMPNSCLMNVKDYQLLLNAFKKHYPYNGDIDVSSFDGLRIVICDIDSPIVAFLDPDRKV